MADHATPNLPSSDFQATSDFYGRLGFTFAPAHGIYIELPHWAPREAAQMYPLSNYHPQVRGRIDYPPEIAATAR